MKVNEVLIFDRKILPKLQSTPKASFFSLPFETNEITLDNDINSGNDGSWKLDKIYSGDLSALENIEIVTTTWLTNDSSNSIPLLSILFKNGALLTLNITDTYDGFNSMDFILKKWDLTLAIISLTVIFAINELRLRP